MINSDLIDIVDFSDDIQTMSFSHNSDEYLQAVNENVDTLKEGFDFIYENNTIKDTVDAYITLDYKKEIYKTILTEYINDKINNINDLNSTFVDYMMKSHLYKTSKQEFSLEAVKFQIVTELECDIIQFVQNKLNYIQIKPLNKNTPE